MGVRQPIHMCLVDLEMAFDRVLQDYGVLGPLMRPVRSLYGRSQRMVPIAGRKLDFPVRVGLCQGCPLAPILFITCMDRISRCSYGDLRIGFLLFADDLVLLASLAHDLQVRSESEEAGMRMSTSKSEAMVLSRKKVDSLLQVGKEIQSQVEEFKYCKVLFTIEGKMKREIDRCIQSLLPSW